MKQTTPFYPRVHVDTAPVAAAAQAGGVMLTETIAATALAGGLRAALAPWRKDLAVHDPAKVLLDLALTVALGGECLADIAVIRGEPGLYGPVASDPTISRTIDALAGDFARLLGANQVPVARRRAFSVAARSCWRRPRTSH